MKIVYVALVLMVLGFVLATTGKFAPYLPFETAAEKSILDANPAGFANTDSWMTTEQYLNGDGNALGYNLQEGLYERMGDQSVPKFAKEEVQANLNVETRHVLQVTDIGDFRRTKIMPSEINNVALVPNELTSKEPVDFRNYDIMGKYTNNSRTPEYVNDLVEAPFQSISDEAYCEINNTVVRKRKSVEPRSTTDLELPCYDPLAFNDQMVVIRPSGARSICKELFVGAVSAYESAGQKVAPQHIPKTGKCKTILGSWFQTLGGAFVSQSRQPGDTDISLKPTKRYDHIFVTRVGWISAPNWAGVVSFSDAPRQTLRDLRTNFSRTGAVQGLEFGDYVEAPGTRIGQQRANEDQVLKEHLTLDGMDAGVADHVIHPSDCQKICRVEDLNHFANGNLDSADAKRFTEAGRGASGGRGKLEEAVKDYGGKTALGPIGMTQKITGVKHAPTLIQGVPRYDEFKTDALLFERGMNQTITRDVERPQLDMPCDFARQVQMPAFQFAVDTRSI